MTIQKTNYPHIERALEAAYPEKLEYARKAAWAEYRLLLKAAATPKPFWRPISECPKEKGKKYIILMDDGTIIPAQWQEVNHMWQTKQVWRSEYNEYSEKYITHFAEIPPLPTDEVKP